MSYQTLAAVNDQIASLGSDLAALNFGKANASTVGGLSTAVNALQASVGAKADAASVPKPANVAPMAEKVGAAIGAATGKFALEDHQHPRLTSTTYATLGSNGQALVAFTRTFTNKPGLDMSETDATASTQPLVLRGLAWQRDAGGLYTGVTIQGLRAQMLPQLAAVSGILTAVITGVNNLVSTLTGFNVFGGSAAGATVSVIAVARSDV
jgi:hypothetical protein